MSAGPTIVVDVHERRSGIPGFLEGLGAIVDPATLPAGDYLVADDTVVERKRVLDLHASIIKGHFWRQVGKLRSSCPYPYLLVEGTDLDRGPLGPNAVRGACLAVIDLGVALLRTSHQRDSAQWIHRLAVRCQRQTASPDRPAYAQRPKAPAGAASAEAILAAVPGVSVTTARALLEHFGSVASVFGADPAEWLAVPGVGPERARQLAETLNQPWHPAP
jgi:ERCC4-type nuclease